MFIELLMTCITCFVVSTTYYRLHHGRHHGSKRVVARSFPWVLISLQFQASSSPHQRGHLSTRWIVRKRRAADEAIVMWAVRGSEYLPGRRDRPDRWPLDNMQKPRNLLPIRYAYECVCVVHLPWNELVLITVDGQKNEIRRFCALIKTCIVKCD